MFTNPCYKSLHWPDTTQLASDQRGVMLFNKIFLVLLVGILGTSWLPDGRSNGLAFGWFWKSVTVIRCEEKKNSTEATTEVPKEVLKEVTTKVPTIDDIPLEDEEFAPLTVGIWIVDKYYRLPNAPYYKLDIKEGTSRSTTHLPNPYYKGGPIIIKD